MLQILKDKIETITMLIDTEHEYSKLAHERLNSLTNVMRVILASQVALWIGFILYALTH